MPIIEETRGDRKYYKAGPTGKPYLSRRKANRQLTAIEINKHNRGKVGHVLSANCHQCERDAIVGCQQCGYSVCSVACYDASMHETHCVHHRPLAMAAPPQFSTPVPSFIITAPHSKCDLGPPCDRGAGTLAREFERALRSAGITPDVLPPTISRKECDLNRPWCADTPDLLRYQAHVRGGATVLDAHSYPPDYAWGLDRVPTKGIVLRPSSELEIARAVDVRLLDRMMAWAGPTASREIVGNKRTLILLPTGEVFFALLQGTSVNFIMTYAESHGATGVLAEINDATAADLEQARFFAESVTAAALDALPIDARIVYSPAHGVAKRLMDRTVEIYLAPSDIHTVHAPISGRITALTPQNGRFVTMGGSRFEADANHTAHLVVDMSSCRQGAGFSLSFWIAVGKPEYITDNLDFFQKVGSTVRAGDLIGRINVGSRIVVMFNSGSEGVTFTDWSGGSNRVIPNSILAHY